MVRAPSPVVNRTLRYDKVISVRLLAFALASAVVICASVTSSHPARDIDPTVANLHDIIEKDI
jgi:hypothetical protein